MIFTKYIFLTQLYLQYNTIAPAPSLTWVELFNVLFAIRQPTHFPKELNLLISPLQGGEESFIKPITTRIIFFLLIIYHFPKLLIYAAIFRAPLLYDASSHRTTIISPPAIIKNTIYHTPIFSFLKPRWVFPPN